MRKGIGKFKLFVVFIVFLVLAIFIPIFVNCLFSCSANVNVVEAKYNPGDLLCYLGSALASIGTISLGCISLWLEMRIQEESDKAQAQRDLWERNNTKRPFFVVDSIHCGKDVVLQNDENFILDIYQEQDSVDLDFRFENVGDGPAVKICVFPDTSSNPSLEGLKGNQTCQVGAFCSFSQGVNMATWCNKGSEELFSLVYRNILGQVYRQEIHVEVTQIIEPFPLDKPYFDGTSYIDYEYKQVGYKLAIKPISYQKEQLVPSKPQSKDSKK